MNKIKSFLNLVEIQTKVASVIPFLIGVLFSLFRYKKLDVLNLSILFISMICLDMATTAINNYMDYRKTQEENVIQLDGLKEKLVILIIFLLLGITVVSGVILFLRTDLIVLLIGIIGIIIGVLYSYGPLPLSYTPLGELFSGSVMGGLIFFVTVYIQQETGFIISFYFEEWFLKFDINVVELGVLILTSLPLVLTISNIMLANNLCDLEKDKVNGRLTLPIVLGSKWGLIIFNTLYIVTYMVIMTSIILEVLPITSILVLITVIPVVKSVRVFNKTQSKKDTFVISVKNFVLISLAIIISLIIALFI